MTEKKNYRAKAATGERDKLYPVFPGIWLAFQDVEELLLFPLGGKFPSGLLEITHCREGRLEYQDSHRAFVLGEGGLVHPPNPKRGSGASLSRQAVPGAVRPDSPGAGASLHLLLSKGRECEPCGAV